MEAYAQIGCNDEVPAQSRSELDPAKAGDAALKKKPPISDS
jgi:hypothetical protein